MAIKKLEWLGRKPTDPKTLKGGAVVLLSGGIDSAVALGLALQNLLDDDKDRVVGLFIDYGQRSLEAEAIAAHRIAANFDIPVKYVRINFAGISQSSLLGDGEVSDQKSTFVPGRNIIFLSYAASVAYSYGCTYVVTGIAPGSGEIYPDTTEQFARAMQTALCIGLGATGEPSLYNPLLKVKDKLEICRMAARLDIDLHHTVSCYDAKVVSLGLHLKLSQHSHWIVTCGKCISCKVRAWVRESMSDVTITNADALRGILSRRRSKPDRKQSE